MRHIIPGKKPPKVILPHLEPKSPPESGGILDIDIEETAQEMSRQFLSQGQLYTHRDRRIGVLQGPHYRTTNLYNLEAHEDNDSTKPLLKSIQSRQQFEVTKEPLKLELKRLPELPGYSSSPRSHQANKRLDLSISDAFEEELVDDGVDLDFEPDSSFEFEIEISKAVFKLGILDKARSSAVKRDLDISMVDEVSSIT